MFEGFSVTARADASRRCLLADVSTLVIKWAVGLVLCFRLEQRHEDEYAVEVSRGTTLVLKRESLALTIQYTM